MFLVPKYTATNYRQIILSPYDPMQALEWINFNEILNFLNDKNLDLYKNLDARRIWVNYPQEVVESKLLLPTLYTCNYFFWNIWHWKHTWIDIILPKWTPIIAFDSWVVSKIKKWDWHKQNEWNCIVIKWPTCYRSYFHCDEILVKSWDYIQRWQKIATVWKTWNATQFHLHLQCDNFKSPFQPFFSENLEEIKKYTIDPLKELKKILPHTNIFYDMPLEPKYYQSILFLYEKWIIKGHWHYIYPLNFLKRYEFALIIYRLLKKMPDLAKNLNKIDDNFKFEDINWLEKEALEAIEYLKKYWILKWFKNKFEPFKNIKWQEVLAVFWRLFRNIKDQNVWHWYQPYIEKFEKLSIIDKNREFIWIAIFRQEVFRILYEILKNQIT